MSVVLIPKVPVPAWHTEAYIQSPEGEVRILKDRVVPGGGWHHVMYRDTKNSEPRPVVVVYCPGCGKEGYLLDYKISADGIPDASLECPHKPCTFHKSVQLQGYEA